MNKMGFYLIGLALGIIMSSLWGLAIFSRVQFDSITLEPVKDKYRDKILYYIDTNTDKIYKLSGDVLYYLED